MDKKKLYNDSNFQKLCDIVAKDNLICITGSGISSGLKVKKYDSAPTWKALLTNIYNEIGTDVFSREENRDVKTLLYRKSPPGDHLIEVASILFKKDEKLFYKSLVDSVNLKRNETSLTHRNLLDLCPRGIVTFNYDVAHENAMRKAGTLKKWDVILPKDSDKIINMLKKGIRTPFLFKAHGTVKQPQTMILTGTSYRELFNQYPYYRVFMQHIFTNFNLLIIGFGLTDPDFDILLQNVFSIFGSPIQEHIVIKHKKQKSPQDTLFKLRYGLNFLYVDDFKDIPDILNECVSYPGPLLKAILQDCISTNFKIRGKAHREIRNLSNTGIQILTNILESKILDGIQQEQNDDYSCNTQTSEYVYSYGVIANATRNIHCKDFLIKEVVEKSEYSEPVAHALVHLRDLLDINEIDLVEKWLKTFEYKTWKIDENNEDADNRIISYCRAIYHLLSAKKRS